MSKRLIATTSTLKLNELSRALDFVKNSILTINKSFSKCVHKASREEVFSYFNLKFLLILDVN